VAANDPRAHLLAVWPGMGQVALTAGFYLMSKLHMHEEEPLDTSDLFDLDHIDVKKGLARAGHVPVSHLYSRKGADLGLVIGEAQPPLHKLEYCRRILDGAERLGVARVFTFAAMAVDVHAREPSRVFGVATDAGGLAALRRHRIEILESGQIQGMNGVFLAAAARRGIPGLCLLGSMPSFATPLPYPKASHVVLEAFAALCNLTVDLDELREYGQNIEQQWTEGLEKIQQALQGAPATKDAADPPASDGDRRQIEELFEQATRDRSKSFELKRVLDRMGVFKEYENRFLDLFRKKP